VDCVVMCWRLHKHQIGNNDPFYFKWSQHEEINANHQVTNTINYNQIDPISRVYKSSQMVTWIFYFQVWVLNFMGNFPYLIMLIVFKLGHFIDTLSLGLFGNFSRFLGIFSISKFCEKTHWWLVIFNSSLLP
jgi:hypothetical protein